MLGVGPGGLFSKDGILPVDLAWTHAFWLLFTIAGHSRDVLILIADPRIVQAFGKANAVGDSSAKTISKTQTLMGDTKMVSHFYRPTIK